MTRTYGRAPAGERVSSDAPGHWESIALACGSRLSGPVAAPAFPGALDTARFEDDVAEVLVPELRTGDVVIWDDLQPHRSEEAVEAVEEAGASAVPWPPWSPDRAPIEEMVSKVKDVIRAIAARATGAVEAAFASGAHDVTPEDIAGWFGDRAAYAMQL
jgi:DDE superfamily endonuclease